MNRLNKKSQFAMEFILLITFMLIVFLGFFAVVSYTITDLEENKKQQAAENIAALVDNEIKLARSVNDGYEKTFTVPKKIEGNNYTISIIENKELVVIYLEYEYVLFLPENIMGNVSTGLNEIKKNNSIVYLRNIET